MRLTSFEVKKWKTTAHIATMIIIVITITAGISTFLLSFLEDAEFPNLILSASFTLLVTFSLGLYVIFSSSSLDMSHPQFWQNLAPEISSFPQFGQNINHPPFLFIKIYSYYTILQKTTHRCQIMLKN